MSASSSCISCGSVQVLESDVCPQCGFSHVQKSTQNSPLNDFSNLKQYVLNPVNRTKVVITSGALVLATALIVSISGSGTSVGGVSSNAAASDYVTGYNRNIMRMNGMDVVDSNGNSLSLGQFAANYVSYLESRLGYQVSADDVAEGLLPGNSLDSALHQFFFDENAIAVVGIEMQHAAG